MRNTAALIHLSDRDLLAEVENLAHRERRATAELIAALAELDGRRLYLGEGCSSLFGYCTRVLRLSEHAAYGRIEAARAAQRFPIILDLLTEGGITLTTVTLLAPHLTPENHRDVLAAAHHKSKRDVEHLVARLAPRPDVRAAVRKLPAPRSIEPIPPQPALAAVSDEPGAPPRSCTSTLPKQRAVVAPLAPERYRVQFTASRETYEKLRRAQDLLRHVVPDGDPAVIVDRALTLLLATLAQKKQGAARRPRPPRAAAIRARHIPAAVRREVWTRDGGRCAFVGTTGRCGETGFLEYHHLQPYAAGGLTVAANVQLRCRAHNAYEADLFFGPDRPCRVRERRAVDSVQTESSPRPARCCGHPWQLDRPAADKCRNGGPNAAHQILERRVGVLTVEERLPSERHHNVLTLVVCGRGQRGPGDQVAQSAGAMWYADPQTGEPRRDL